MVFVLISLHVLNVYPGKTECMSEPVEGMAEHAVVIGSQDCIGVDCVVDLSSLVHNLGPVETECISEQVGGMAEHAVVIVVINELILHSDGCSHISAVLWKLRSVAAVCY